MTGTQRIEHAVLRVPDVVRAVEFYAEAMGLAVLEQAPDRAFLGCGLDGRFDLGLVEGGTGVEHFAIRVEDDAQLTDVAASLERTDALDDHTEAPDEAVEASVTGSLPSGIGVEFVTVPDRGYRRVNEPAADRAGIAPHDLDHITLMTDRIKEDVGFVEDLGFSVSEIHELDGGDWRFAWTRFGQQHHDIAFVNTDEPAYTLHHLAFHFPSLDHIKTHIDHLASEGHRIEIGVNRHAVGSNVFAYFRAPDGNRIELSAEMATLDETTPTRVNPPEMNTLTAWGGVEAPETFKEGT